jgi:hypothetical protein
MHMHTNNTTAINYDNGVREDEQAKPKTKSDIKGVGEHQIGL